MKITDFRVNYIPINVLNLNKPKTKCSHQQQIIKVQTYKWHVRFVTLVTNRAAALQILKNGADGRNGRSMLKWPH